MSRQEVGKGAAFLYAETIATIFSGYVLWLIITKITTTEVIGTSSAVVSMAGIFSTVVILGVPIGVQRFLGKSYFEQRLKDALVYIRASLFLVSIGIIICSVGIYLAKDWISTVFKFDTSLIIISILFIGSSGLAALLRAIIIASLKTKILPISIIISAIVKLIATVVFVLFNMGALGVTLGFTFYPIVLCIILAASIFLMTTKESKYEREVSFGLASKNTLIAGMPSWIPGVIAIVGSQLGLIVVLGSHGAGQAGVYSIAFSIAFGLSTGMSVLPAIAFPALSAMTDGRKIFAWRTIKMSLTIILPFASCLIFYSSEVMNLFGAAYTPGSLTLSILLLTMVPNAVMSGITSLVYAYGNYKQVLVIGLAATIPRVILYFVLVPIFGGIGAAMSYTSGSLIVLLISAIIARQIGMKIIWKEIIILFIVPTGLAAAFNFVGINYILGTLLVMIISYIMFLKLLILTRSDVQDVLSILPSSIANSTLTFVTMIAKKLNSSF